MELKRVSYYFKKVVFDNDLSMAYVPNYTHLHVFGFR